MFQSKYSLDGWQLWRHHWLATWSRGGNVMTPFCKFCWKNKPNTLMEKIMVSTFKTRKVDLMLSPFSWNICPNKGSLSARQMVFPNVRIFIKSVSSTSCFIRTTIYIRRCTFFRHLIDFLNDFLLKLYKGYSMIWCWT